MTIQSTWRQAIGAAKLGLGAAVVAGVMAFSAPAHAVTAGSVTWGSSLLPGSTTGNLLPLNFDTITNDIEAGDAWNITMNTLDESGTSADPLYASVGFQALEDLGAIAASVQLPSSGFTYVEAAWSDTADGTGATFTQIPATTSISLTTTFLLNEIKYLVFRWYGDLSPASGASTISTNLTAAIPLPAGLVLFLSGLAGIGFLGRYKAKRREPAVA